jgi:modulator of FtsH protease
MATMAGTVDKIFGTTQLDSERAALIKKTYALLSVSVVTAIAGGYLGSHSLDVVRVFVSPLGWLLAMVLLNLIPAFALWASRQSPGLGIIALAADGFVSGLTLSPALWYAQLTNPEIVPAALGITGAAFVGVTGFMMTTKERFSAPRGLLTGMFVSLMFASILNLFLGLPLLHTIIAAGIGIFGVVMLVYATSDVLDNPDYSHPVQGALMLFAALFNIFVSALHLLLRFFGGGRRD